MIDVDIEQRLNGFELAVAFQAQAPVVGLFGRSGSGKTTLVNAFAGITRPRRGHIVVNGEVLFDSEHGIDLPPEKRRLGYVFQDDLLFPHLTAEANLLYGFHRAPGPARVIDPAHVVDLLGLKLLLRRFPGALSGGERQRVAIGRALLAQPRLLLMDEPLASLDVLRQNEVLRYIEQLRDDLHIPIVYVSHSVAEITRLADTVVLLAEGKSLAVGDVDDVMGRMELRPHTGRHEAGAVVETTVAAHDLGDGLATLRFEGGELIVPNVEALVGERVRVRIRARDVALATEQPHHLSVLNVLKGSVVAVAREDSPIVDVRLQVGSASLVARITRRSCSDLGLAPGAEIYALIKAVSIDRRSVGYA
ncbi:MAG TPA: molybdenum ABC transporter ATP-binding protein [Casimicrobiaceae bacterium]|nr:molybdenum ABC transporter ATP-binding protein [Casimicrobiaceae bacterium]